MGTVPETCGRRILLEKLRGNGAVGRPCRLRLSVCLASTLRTELGEEGDSEVRRESLPQLLDAVFGKSLVVYVRRPTSAEVHDSHSDLGSD